MRACARLGGYFPESSELSTPENVPVKKSLTALLTPFLAKKLSNENSKEVSAIHTNLIKNCCNAFTMQNIFLFFSTIVDTSELVCFLQLLKLLNSNSENPYLIWDNATRAQLTEYLTNQQQQVIKTVSVYPYIPYIDIYPCVLYIFL